MSQSLSSETLAGSDSKLEVIAPESAAPFNVADAIRGKLTSAGMSPAAAAKEIGISYVAVLNVINKGSNPNTRTAAKLAAWLGVDTATILSAAKSAKMPKAPKAAKRSDGVKAPKATRSTAEVLAIVKAALNEAKAVKTAAAHPILKDKLALAVYGADKKMRAMVELMLSKFA